MKKQKLTVKQEEWLQLLESGKYRQTDGVLFDGKKYCCLGIATRLVCGIDYTRDTEWDGLASYKFENLDSSLPKSAQRALKMGGANGEILYMLKQEFYDALREAGYKGEIQLSLANYNDALSNATFKQIAAAIRAVPLAVFY